ncbi:class I adenylate-forming enzyme family protein [Nocardia cyriacigeorgica]|uniref:class I adenylate-forming enzyme family protein n=1 Tax=Nocardia cyriacigeorgica TaxID=135487 RepID=UPI002455BC0F|nr:AMP-binding protein [Nocardia cyriacigeorgica]
MISSTTILTLLRTHADLRPAAPFILFEGPDRHRVELTYRSMYRRAMASAAVLRDRGVGPEDRVVVVLPNCVEFLDLWFATAVLGGVFVPVNPAGTAEELSWILADTDCALSIGDGDTVDRLRDASELAGRSSAPVLATSVSSAAADYDAAGYYAADEGGGYSPDSTAAILYTSGTTSRPKGVVVTHANYVNAGEAVAGHLRIRSDDRWLVVLPLFHANAQYYCLMSALMSGASVAITNRFSASNWGRQVRELDATLASLFAAPMRMILESTIEPDDGENRLRATLFAQNLRPELIKAFKRRFRTPLLQLYGMTETIAPATFNPLYLRQRSESIGPPLGGRPLRLVDINGQDVATGEVGELLVGGVPGRTLMAGYLGNPAATAAALDEGWLRTGDLARADDDGYLYFVDRAKDMIKRAGENVAAAEVERVVDQHPAVAESAAVGIADPVRDEAIVVHVVLKPGSTVAESELLDWCAQRLSSFKVPSAMHFRAELPRTSVGKVRKDLLRAQSVGTAAENASAPNRQGVSG